MAAKPGALRGGATVWWLVDQAPAWRKSHNAGMAWRSSRCVLSKAKISTRSGCVDGAARWRAVAGIGRDPAAAIVMRTSRTRAARAIAHLAPRAIVPAARVRRGRTRPTWRDELGFQRRGRAGNGARAVVLLGPDVERDAPGIAL